MSSTVFQRIKSTIRPMIRLKQQVLSFHNISERRECAMNQKKEKQQSMPIHVLFILQYPEMWNSMKPIHDYMNNDIRFRVSTLLIPQKENESFGSIEKNEKFCIENNIDYIKALNNNCWLEIESLNLDYIFISRAYDEYMPKEYSMSELSKIAPICYVSYSGHMTKGIHLDIEFNKNALENVTYFFADNNSVAEYIKKMAFFLIKKEMCFVYEEGFSRFDLLSKQYSKKHKKLVVLWTPRWSVDTENDRSHFMDYYELLLDYFRANPDKELIIRPHPLMFDNFVKNNVLTKNDVRRIYEEVNSCSNVMFDKNIDYNVSFTDSDIMLTDPTSLVLEYFITGKPVIYCGGKRDDLNKEAKEMFKFIYFANDDNQVLSTLNRIASGDDYYLEGRLNIIEKVLKADGKVSERISNRILQASANN